MSLVALADVNAWLKLPSGHADEALLTRLIGGASGFVESWCNRSFGQQDYAEPRDGNGGTRMTPSGQPVTNVAGVTIGTVSVPKVDISSTASGFFFSGKSVQLRGYVFERGQMNVTLLYTAGYSVIPAEIQQAVIELVALRYRERDRPGMASVSQAGETTSYITKDMPASVATLIGQFKHVVPR